MARAASTADSKSVARKSRCSRFFPTLGLRHGQEEQSDTAGAEVHVAVGVDARLSAYEPLPPRGQRGRVRAVDADTLDPLFEGRDAF